ncbi:MAG: CocE/NonD family hydrolase [Actinophytocola sp.]|nr:CocE/NonD family hydrolase [Actinophytocola sp.]
MTTHIAPRQRFARPHALVLALVLAAPTMVLSTPQAAADPPTHDTGYIPVAVGTPDETTLHYKVMLPDPGRWGPGPYPAVIDYSGYLPAIDTWGAVDPFVDAGYAAVGLNIRGTSCSGGRFDYFEPRQAIDGAEAIGWLARQDWSNGRFGMVGKSYPGITQAFVAAERPEALKAIVPGHIFADLYRDVPFPGGIMNATFAGGWSAQRVYESYLVGPVHSAETGDEQCMRNQAEHAPNAAFNPLVRLLTQMWDGPIFRQRSPWEFADRIDVPTFLIESWQDEQVGSRGTHLLDRLRRDEVPWRFLATNGDHSEYYGEEVLPHILRFLSYYLKQEIPAGDQFTVTEPARLPNGDPHPTRVVSRPATFDEALARYEAEDPVTINWENGARGTRRAAWTDTYADWPAPQQQAWRLSLDRDATLTSDVPRRGSVDYRYVPVVGAQQRGGDDLAGEPAASWADRPPDGTYAAFTSAPLSEDRVLLGSASADLWLSSTATDTDVEVTLTEVRPDGQEVFVQQGWLRASHRTENPEFSTELRPFQTHLLTDSALLVPGEPQLLRVEIFPFGHAFRAGSRIRIAVAAPHLRPDLWGFASLPTPAVNTLHTGGAYRSSLTLPLLRGESARVSLPECGSLRNQPCRPEPAGSASTLGPGR